MKLPIVAQTRARLDGKNPVFMEQVVVDIEGKPGTYVFWLPQPEVARFKKAMQESGGKVKVTDESILYPTSGMALNEFSSSGGF